MFSSGTNEAGKSADVYVDLGTANTLLAVRGKGLVINEPTLIAYAETGSKRKVVGVGLEAKELISKTPGTIIAYRPLKEGVIADYDTTETLIRYYLKKLGYGSFFRKPSIIISLPYGVTEVEKRAAIDAGKSAGAKEVFLIDEPMAAAIGADLPVKQAKGSMILDIGGGTTEVAVIALADIVYCQALRVGGHRLDESIGNYLKRKRSLVVADTACEQLKIKLGTATPKKDIQVSQVQGRDVETGLPKTIDVSSEEIGYAMDDNLNEIVNLIHAALEKTPPELVSDIIETGLTLAGGGALIRDLDLRLQNEVRLSVRIAEDPLLTIAKGGLALLSDPELLEKIRLEV